MSVEERQCLILQHLPRVRLLARRLHGRLPANVSLDDLVSTGVVGLISAIDRFDPSQRVPLGAYAEQKIRGGMLDSLRRLDWAPRQQRKRAKQIEAAIAAVAQRLHRAPTEQEIATELNITVNCYRKWQVNARALNLGTLEAAESEDPEKRDLLRCICGDPSELPLAVLERKDLQRALDTAISGLPKIHQTVIRLYYRDELRPREISKITGLHESRISSVRSQAILRLRDCMAKLWPTGSAATVPMESSSKTR
ncbi:MAG: FliA/WhiG family RNA polymerase sigma factor [Acidobacteriia bacterium]|nr:FliA/WhiG family RNA polymerase sigma factor [Terriglobia bacterium]